jgi:hypothetical protein
MKPSVPTCQHPDQPDRIYMRLMYHTFFFGPFKDEAEVIAAVKELNKQDSMWDYDCYCVIYGMNPLPKDYVFGFPSVPSEMRRRIDAANDTSK